MSTSIPKIPGITHRLTSKGEISFSLSGKKMVFAPGRSFSNKVPPLIKRCQFSYEANLLKIRIEFENLPKYPLNLEAELMLVFKPRKEIFNKCTRGHKIKGQALDISIPFERPIKLRHMQEIEIAIVEPLANEYAEICSATIIKSGGKWQ